MKNTILLITMFVAAKTAHWQNGWLAIARIQKQPVIILASITNNDLIAILGHVEISCRRPLCCNWIAKDDSQKEEDIQTKIHSEWDWDK